jgi:hypothetical protein
MSDRANDSAKLGVLMVILVLVAAVSDGSGLLGCSSSGGAAGTGSGAAGGGSGTGGGTGDSGGGGGGASGDSGSAGGSGTTGSGGTSGIAGTGGGGVAGTGGSGGAGTGGGAAAGNDGGSPSDGSTLPPTITMLTPSSAHVGDAGFTLVVEGHDFPPNPRVSFDGNIFNTTVVSATRLEASIPGAALGATPRQVSVLVTRIGGSSANSNTLPFQILPAPDGG